MGYVPYSLLVNTDAIVAAVLADLAHRLGLPASQLSESQPLVAMAEALALRVAESRVITADVAASIFKTFGEELANLDPVEATAASMESLWTMVDDDGYTVPAGTRVVYPRSGTDKVAFQTISAFTVDPGDTLAPLVLLEAVIEGEDANDLEPAELELYDALVYVAAVESTSTTSGGLDDETDVEYLDRLREVLTIVSPTPILAPDFAVLARRVSGVYRATAIDNYDADTDTYGQERMVTVAVVDEEGNPLAGAVVDEVEAYLDSLREVNFVVHVIGPTSNAIAVAFTGTAESGHDPDVVEAAAIAALNTYLDPGVWGGGDESPPEWRRDLTVRRHKLIGILEQDVTGLLAVLTLTLNGGTSDVTMTGAAPLPDPTVTGTVTV